jgi:hypothetical protein
MVVIPESHRDLICPVLREFGSCGTAKNLSPDQESRRLMSAVYTFVNHLCPALNQGAFGFWGGNPHPPSLSPTAREKGSHKPLSRPAGAGTAQRS